MKNYKVSGKKLYNPYGSNSAMRHAVKAGHLSPSAAQEPLWHMLGVKGKTKKFVQRLSLRRLNNYHKMNGKRGSVVGDLLCSM